MAEATPLCSTCVHHEKQTTKISIIWGAAWVVGAVIGPITVGIIVALIFVNRTNIDVVAQQVTVHERAMNGSLHEIEQTLNTVSINQKRLMEKVGVQYIHPERIHNWEDK